MENFICSIRDVGPLMAIAHFLNNIKNYRVFVLVTEPAATAVACNEVFINEDVQVLCYYRGEWISLKEYKKSYISNENACAFTTEFAKGYLELKESIYKLFQLLKPKKLLRTTPAYKWGVDEAVLCVAQELGVLNECYCYQETYMCGVELERMQNPIAVVDSVAYNYLTGKGISAIEVGWLSLGKLNDSQPYVEARVQARKKLGIDFCETAILYCVTASTDFSAELMHYNEFLNSIGGISFFIKFHPRTLDNQKKLYLQLAKGRCKPVDSLSYDEVLAFSDFLISSASMINFDCVMYQLLRGDRTFHTIPVYTVGPITAIIKRMPTYNNEELILPMNGNLVIKENDYRDLKFVNQKNARQLFLNAQHHYSIDIEANINKMFRYMKI